MLKEITKPLWRLLLIISKKERDFELNCDECLVVLEYLAEMAESMQDDNEKYMALIKRHLAHCPDCRDYYLLQLAQLEAYHEKFSDK